MERSIENIWSRGFLKEEEMVAPKVNALYNRKSVLLIEKLKRTYRVDNKSILPLAVLSVVGFGLAGHLITGLYLAILMLGMFFLNKRKLAVLESIRINSSTYDYLVKYRQILIGLKSFYTRLLGIGVPIAGMLGYYLFFRNTPLLEDLLGLGPFYILLILLGVSLLLSAIGILAYRLSTKLVYGRFLKKLDEMISEMQELRS